MVAGFWIRLASDVLDAILLGLFGLCLSLPFRSALYMLGENGVWIGLCVTFLYAGILQSRVVVYKSRFDHHALAALDDPGRARRSYIIAGGSGLAMVVATFVLGQGLTASPTMGRLLRAQGRIANQTSLENVSVQERWSRSFGPNSRTTTTLVVNGFLLKSSYDDAARQSLEAKKAADALLDAYGRPLDFDGINVTVRTGYNIGITNFTQSNQHFFDRDGLPSRNR